MSQPAARVGDLHVCPQQTPGVPPIPHIGGLIILSGVPTVLIGGKPAATVGNQAICSGCPGVMDTIIKGSTKVLIAGKPAARLGDTTAHGGTITMGCPTVLLG